MLKRSAAILLILLYISTVSGFALNLHYCFNRLSSVKIDAPPSSKTRAAAKMKCCHDTRIEVKVKDAHKAEAKSTILKIFNEKLLLILVDGGLFTAPSSHTNPIVYRGPPGALCQAPVYLINRNFRI